MKHQLVELGYLKSAHSTSGASATSKVQPRRNGQILIGWSRPYRVEHKDVESGILERMLQPAKPYMPGLSQMSQARPWAGFCAATPDKRALTGPWPADESVFPATGHEGPGITTSLGTARILVDQITGAKPPIPVEPHQPSRVAEERVHA